MLKKWRKEEEIFDDIMRKDYRAKNKDLVNQKQREYRARKEEE